MDLSCCCFFCLVFVMPLYASVYLCLVVTCWERADLLALICGVYIFLSFFLSLLVRSYMSITPGSANLEILIK